MKSRAAAGRPVGGVIIALLTAILYWGCASAPAPDALTVFDDRTAEETACEVALLKLEKLLEARATQRSFSVPALLEARELHRIGRELYLEREYALALELIEEGIQLVEEQ
jgi:hypothetical protein